MTSKQRAYLRGLANGLDPIFQIGKGGINDNMADQISEALENRELNKETLQLSTDHTAPRCSASATGLCCIGRAGRTSESIWRIEPPPGCCG